MGDVDKMKLSTKGRYGLRALIDLAVHSKGEQVSLISIAQRQEISESYLESVFSLLKKAGLVTSVKGARGGYILVNRPAEIKIGTVLRALEGDLNIVDMDSGVKEDAICHSIKHNVWDKVNKKINDLVDAVTLEDMINEYYKINGSDAIMYYI